MTPAYGLLFHHFHDAFHPRGQGSISAETFSDIIEFVGRKRILKAEEWMARALEDRLTDGDICLTFDDNLLCQYDVALPVIKALNLTAFWFIYTSPLEGTVEKLELYRYFRTTYFETIDDFYRDFFEVAENSRHASCVEDGKRAAAQKTYLADKPFYSDSDRIFRFVRDRVLGREAYFQLMDQMIEDRGVNVAEVSTKLWMDGTRIRHLRREGHVIGLHSHTHPTLLSALSLVDQEREFGRNHHLLSELLNEAPIAAAYPCGDYNGDTLTVLDRLGIRLCFRNVMDGESSSKLEFPREDHAITMSKMAS